MVGIASNERRMLTGNSALKDTLNRLPYAVEAPFNSYQSQHEPICLDNTRVDVLQETFDWANGQDEYRLQHAKLLRTLPQDPVEVALRLVGLPDIGSARKAMESCLKALDLEDDANLLLKGWGMTDRKATKQWKKMERRVKDTYQGAAARCRRSLAFKDMMAREEIIARPESETCQWIYQDSQYKRWITNDKPLLWIKGKFRCMWPMPRRLTSAGRQSWLGEVNFDEEPLQATAKKSQRLLNHSPEILLQRPGLGHGKVSRGFV